MATRNPHTCANCEESHRATGITLYDKLNYDCENRCPIPQLLPENLVAMELIWRFGAFIYDGESISAEAIDRICDWSGIPKKHRWLLSQKIMAYFSTISSEQHKKTEEKRNTATPKPILKGRK